MKHTWDKLGEELDVLAKLHAEKGQAYQDCVRKPLIELLPQLEEKRKEVSGIVLCVGVEVDEGNVQHYQCLPCMAWNVRVLCRMELKKC